MISRRARILILLCLTLIGLMLYLDRQPLPVEATTRMTLPPTHTSPPLPFVTDGCTLFPNQLLGADLTPACIIHDYAYWQGGEPALRHTADVALREAVTSELDTLGAPVGSLVYVGVRLFGDTWLTRLFNAHWGFGFDA